MSCRDAARMHARERADREQKPMVIYHGLEQRDHDREPLDYWYVLAADEPAPEGPMVYELVSPAMPGSPPCDEVRA